MSMPTNQPDIDSISFRVNQWLFTHPDATTIPHHIETLLHAERKHTEANRLKAKVISPDSLKIKDELEERLLPHADRKNAELELADYIDSIDDFDGLKLDRIVSRMRTCRRHGVVGRTRDYDNVHVWDEKCSCSKLCPHEARDETRRLINKYLPHITKFTEESTKNRAFYSVFSTRNYKPGELATGKKEIIEKFKEWKKQFPQVKGALIVQEDPLSAGHDWNVHINVILLVEGEFNYKTARSVWGNEYQLYFDLITKDNIVKTMCECIKYCAVIVAEKSETKANSNQSKAPGMTAWPTELWLEWFKANKKFRRTRSYGCLYKVKDEGTDKDLTDIEWFGEINFSNEGRYLVSLTQGDNFGRRYQRTADLFYDFDDNYDNWSAPP